jgi:hypothetical protein
VGGGESDLGRLIAELSPVLSQERYAFEGCAATALGADAFAMIREDEGLTVIRKSDRGTWARISLGLHSSLEAVGLTAALSRALADAGISANFIAGLKHDHIFVPWDRRHDALAALRLAKTG